MRTFFDRYRSYASGCTDAPEVFHDFVSRVVVGTVVGNRMYIRHGSRDVHPNLWLALVAPSSLFRKSTAIELGARLVADFDPALLMRPRMRPASLASVVGPRPWGLFVFDDWDYCTSLCRRDTSSGDSPWMTDYYDAPRVWIEKKVEPVRRPQPRWQFRAPEPEESPPERLDPAVSILAESSLATFHPAVTAADIETGFLSRFLFVSALTKERRMDRPKEPDPEAAGKLARELVDIGQYEGVMPLSEQAEMRFIEECALYEDLAEKLEGSPLERVYARMPVNLLKLALIEQCGTHRLDHVEPESMESAARLCATLVENARRLFARAIPSTAEQKTRERVLDFVRVAGHVQRRDVLRALHLSAHQLTRAALTLIQQESIFARSEGEGKAATVWYTSAERAAKVCL